MSGVPSQNGEAARRIVPNGARSALQQRSCNSSSSSSEAQALDDNAIPERKLSAEEADDQRRGLRCQRDFSVLLDFIETFEDNLHLKSVPSIANLEDSLVYSNGAEADVLTTLHLDLLMGICPSTRSKLTSSTWVLSLWRRCQSYFQFNPQDNPLRHVRQDEVAIAYACLPANVRCYLLRVLCDMRCEKDDLRDLIDGAAKSVSTSRKRKAEELDDDDDADELRREPWGTDACDRRYWIHDWGIDGGIRLCRSTSGRAVAQRCGGAAPVAGARCEGCRDAAEGRWETLATSIDEIEAVGTELLRSRRVADRDLGQSFTEALVPAFRKIDAASRQKTESEGLRTAKLEALREAGRNRSLRARKPVDYSFDCYDAMFSAHSPRKPRDHAYDGALTARERRALMSIAAAPAASRKVNTALTRSSRYTERLTRASPSGPPDAPIQPVPHEACAAPPVASRALASLRTSPPRGADPAAATSVIDAALAESPLAPWPTAVLCERNGLLRGSERRGTDCHVPGGWTQLACDKSAMPAELCG